MNIAIIGYGKMGRLYDSLLHADFIIDPYPVQNRTYFKNIDEFIFYKPNVELVIITTPSFSHYELILKLLGANYNLLVEKPIVLSSIEARNIENIADNKNLVLYQSTLERYNPITAFIQRNIIINNIKEIISYRIGATPQKDYSLDPIFDLGIHDVDLYIYLYNKKVKWTVNVGYGEQKREINIILKNDNVITFDLINRSVTFTNRTLDISSVTNNPILDMINDLLFKGSRMNEKWSEEIKILEQMKSNTIILE